MKITLFPLTSYNEGNELPFTINLDGLTKDTYYGAINAGLFEANYPADSGSVLSSRCTKCKAVFINKVEESCPSCGHDKIEHKRTDADWLIYNSEGVPQKYVGVYNLDIGFFEYVQFLKDTHLDSTIVDAGLNCGLELHEIESSYQGTYDSDAMFAERYAVMNGIIPNADEWPFLYRLERCGSRINA